MNAIFNIKTKERFYHGLILFFKKALTKIIYRVYEKSRVFAFHYCLIKFGFTLIKNQNWIKYCRLNCVIKFNFCHLDFVKM